jgi:hypothetical protein
MNAGLSFLYFFKAYVYHRILKYFSYNQPPVKPARRKPLMI